MSRLSMTDHGAGLRDLAPLQSQASSELLPATDTRSETPSLLNFLRFTALSCRAKPRTDLFHACALLHVSRSRSLEAHAEALMRCLNDAVGKNLRFHAPGTAEMSFDEAWLVQLSDALLRDDNASTSFLLRSRVMPEHRRLVGFLIGWIARSYE